MFDIRITNLNMGYYLHIMPKSLLQRRRRIKRIYIFRLTWILDIIFLLWPNL